MTNLYSILKSRDITLPTEVCLLKALVFPVVIYGCESWTVKKTKIMASGPITSWEIGGETVEIVADFIFLSSQITAHGDCSHEIKRHLLLGRKAMTNLDSILKKQRHYFANKVPSSQSYGFSSSHVWM